jgi:hypothetical protein
MQRSIAPSSREQAGADGPQRSPAVWTRFFLRGLPIRSLLYGIGAAALLVLLYIAIRSLMLVARRRFGKDELFSPFGTWLFVVMVFCVLWMRHHNHTGSSDPIVERLVVLPHERAHQIDHCQHPDKHQPSADTW